MACSTCNKVKVESRLKASDLPYVLTGDSPYVTGKDGRRRRLTMVLVPPMREPRGGWKVSFIIKGQTHEINGYPRDIFNEVKRLFNLNNFRYTTIDLWLNLNLQWTERSVERYQKVTHKNLMAIATPNIPSDEHL